MRIQAGTSLLVVLLAACLAGRAGAAENLAGQRLAKHEKLRISIESGEGKFAALEAADKARLLRAQDHIFALLRGKDESAELTLAERSNVASRESEIVGIVSRIDPRTSLVRCSYQARIGSNRKEKVCKKVEHDLDPGVKIVIDLHK